LYHAKIINVYIILLVMKIEKKELEGFEVDSVRLHKYIEGTE
jgi:hypothetical protein